MNNVSDNYSNLDESKEEKLQFSLNTGSDGKANEEDNSNTFMEMASLDETSFWLHKLVIRTHFKYQIQYVICVTCKIGLISTKLCLI